MIVRLALIALLLTACTVATPTPAPTPTPEPTPTAMPTPVPLTGQQIIARLIDAGLDVADAQPGERPEGMPEHYQFAERVTFTTGGHNGQVYVCEVRPHCDLLVELYKSLEEIGGKYYFLSSDGLFIVQLNRDIPPEVAEQFRAVVEDLP